MKIPAKKFWFALGGVVVIALIAIGIKISTQPGIYDTFAKCLTEKGAKFYGAFWCPHCQKQKALFGKSEKYVPYVECSTPNGQGMLPICQEHKIEGFPTWVFTDGSRLTGETSLQSLATKTACDLPEAAPIK